MGDVEAISHKALTPELLLETVAKDLEGIEDMFIVVFHKDGTACEYACGDLGSLALAALRLQRLALMYSEGEVEHVK